MKWVILCVALAGCSIISKDHSKDPKSCRERVALYLHESYPDPNNLILAINGVCGDTP